MNARFKTLPHRVKRILRRISAIEEELDRLLWELLSITNGGDDKPASSPPEPIDSLVISLRENGGSRVSTSAGEVFDLPSRLTKLLLVALSGHAGTDGLRSYRLFSDATKELGCSNNALSSLVYQLRGKLEDYGLHPELLQTTRRPAMLRFRAREVVVIEE